MDSRWDGHERRRGRSPEELRKHLRELLVSWETNRRETQPEYDAEGPAMSVHCNDDVHGDNDEERSARVEAMLEMLQATNSTTRRAVARSNTRNGRRRVGAKR